KNANAKSVPVKPQKTAKRPARKQPTKQPVQKQPTRRLAQKQPTRRLAQKQPSKIQVFATVSATEINW
ncbi:MAG: hypothetical protein WCT05_15425, partial [Lentisphaeria bacterium]